jgi:hypothetical protein
MSDGSFFTTSSATCCTAVALACASDIFASFSSSTAVALVALRPPLSAIAYMIEVSLGKGKGRCATASVVQPVAPGDQEVAKGVQLPSYRPQGGEKGHSGAITVRDDEMRGALLLSSRYDTKCERYSQLRE